MGILQTKLNELNGEIERSVREVTDRIEVTLVKTETEKASTIQPGTTVRETIGKPLVQLNNEVKSQGDSFRGSVNAMLGRVETAERQIQQRVNQSTVALDSLVDKTSKSVETFRMQVESAIKTAETTMETIKKRILEFKDMILISFETLHSSTLERAMDALDKIPAENLPKMLVNPTVSAIENVIKQITKQISTASTKAGQQMETIGTQISDQVENISSQAMQRMADFQKQLMEQLSTIQTTIRDKINEINQKIREIIAAAIEQINTIKARALEQINAFRARIEEAVDTLVQSIKVQIQTLKETSIQQIDAFSVST
jgi:ElaB/YqjD/DUF883 family membrane-anchored ribosome-binding protein